MSAAVGLRITTVEGPGREGQPHPVQAAFLTEQAGQCGYCLSGMVMSAAALLRDNPDPSDHEIREGLSGNFCRCTGYQGIVAAARRAAETQSVTQR